MNITNRPRRAKWATVAVVSLCMLGLMYGGAGILTILPGVSQLDAAQKTGLLYAGGFISGAIAVMLTTEALDRIGLADVKMIGAWQESYYRKKQ